MKFNLIGVFLAMLLAYIMAIFYLAKKDEFKLKIKTTHNVSQTTQTIPKTQNL